MRTTSLGFGLVIILALSAVILLWAVGAIIYLVRHRRQKQRLTHGPICGRCGYGASIGPDGFTRCPECGGDYAKVGVIGPGTRTGNSAILLSAGLGWVLAVTFFGVLTTYAVGQWLTVTTTTVTINNTGSWSAGRGPTLGLDMTTVATSVTGRSKPTSDITTLKLTAGLASPQIIIDNNTDTITSSTDPAIPVGAKPDAAVAKKLVGDLLPDAAPAELAAFQAEIVTAFDQRFAAAKFSPVMGVRSSSSSSVGGRMGLNSTTGSSSSSSSSSAIGLGSWLMSNASFNLLMASIFFVIAVLGLWFLARTARPPKSTAAAAQ